MRLAGARVEATRVRHILSKHGTATQRRPGRGQQEPDRGAACVSSVPEASRDSASRRAGAVRSGLGAARAMLAGAAWATWARAQMDTHRQADGSVAVTMDAAGPPRGPRGSPPPGAPAAHGPTGTPQPPPSRPPHPHPGRAAPLGKASSQEALCPRLTDAHLLPSKWARLCPHLAQGTGLPEGRATGRLDGPP